MMGKAVEITRLERSAAELRALAVKIEDADVVRRLLGIALLLDGWPRGEAAEPVGWTGRRCATGCIATTQVMLPAWRLRRGLGVRRR